jgi:hypothetical protein
MQKLHHGVSSQLNTELTAKLFARATAIWGSRFTASIATKELYAIAVYEWSQALLGVSEEQLSIAFTKARDSLDYPPSPAEIKKLVLGIVSRDKAYSLALNKGKYKDLLDSWSWKNMNEADLKKKFYAVYENYVDEMLTNNQT